MNFYYGMLLSKTFIKFLDYWADWISILEQLDALLSIVLSQWVPKLTKQLYISANCLGSIF